MFGIGNEIAGFLDDVFSHGGKGLEFKPGKTFHNAHANNPYIDGDFYLDGVGISQKEAFEKFPIRAAWLTGQLTYKIVLAIIDLVSLENRDIYHIENVITWIIESDQRLDAFVNYNSGIGVKLGKLHTLYTTTGQNISSFPTKTSFSRIEKIDGGYKIFIEINGESQEEILLSPEEVNEILTFRVRNNTKLSRV